MRFSLRMGQGSDGACPDAELLASYIDGRTTSAERIEVETHLMRCRDCLVVVLETCRLELRPPGSLNTGVTAVRVVP
jgi:hypothetical protein